MFPSRHNNDILMVLSVIAIIGILQSTHALTTNVLNKILYHNGIDKSLVLSSTDLVRNLNHRCSICNGRSFQVGTQMSAQYRRNRYYPSSSSARNNSNMTEFEKFTPTLSSINAANSAAMPLFSENDKILDKKTADDKEEVEYRAKKFFTPFAKQQILELSNDINALNNITSINSPSNQENDPDNLMSSNTVCRIVASADYKIPPSLLHNKEQKPNDLLTQIDALSHAATHQKTQNQLQYMESIHKTYQLIKGDANNNMIYDNILYNQDNEQKVVLELRKSLEDSGFQLLTQRDLELCQALNEGYLLRLSILPDVAGLDPSIGKEFYPELYKNKDQNVVGSKNQNEKTSDLLFDGRILVYRRGYSEEVTRGRLLLPKFDYLQSSLVQRTASKFAKKLGNLERRFSSWLIEILNDFLSQILNELPKTVQKQILKVTKIDNIIEENSDRTKSNNQNSSINKLALGRYRTGKAIDTFDNNDALSPFLVCEVSDEMNIESDTDAEKDLYEVLNEGTIVCQHDLNQDGRDKNMNLLRRVSISNLVDFFSVGGRRRLVKSLFATSELVEPTFEEVILIWRPIRDKIQKKPEIKLPNYVYDIAEIFEVENRLPEKSKSEQKPLPLEIRAFDRVPMANLLAVFPKSKLVFRPADAFLFDLINITTFLAVLSSVRFDNPKLDFLALVSAILWTLRTFFRYSNKLARYDLLVNKFLTRRISHRNSGAFRYILSQGAIQGSRRASLVHQWLDHYIEQSSSSETNVLKRDEIVRVGVSEINKFYQLRKPLQLDIDAALDDLVNMGLLTFSKDGSTLLELKKGDDAKNTLQNLWNNIFTKN